MLVTDGAVDTYDAIFAKYNWPERKVVYETHSTHTAHYSVRSVDLSFPLCLVHNFMKLKPCILMENGNQRAVD